MEKQETQEKQPKIAVNTPITYKKVRLEITGHKDNVPQMREGNVVRELQLSKYDADLLNAQEKNTLIRYKKK